MAPCEVAGEARVKGVMTDLDSSRILTAGGGGEL